MDNKDLKKKVDNILKNLYKFNIFNKNGIILKINNIHSIILNLNKMKELKYKKINVIFNENINDKEKKFLKDILLLSIYTNYIETEFKNEYIKNVKNSVVINSLDNESINNLVTTMQNDIISDKDSIYSENSDNLETVKNSDFLKQIFYSVKQNKVSISSEDYKIYLRHILNNEKNTLCDDKCNELANNRGYYALTYEAECAQIHIENIKKIEYIK